MRSLLASILLVLSFVVLPTVSYAQTKEASAVDYALPYPGILPDHPLYIFKKVRDAILEFLLVDPVRKAEFYILQADKRLAMALAYAQKGQAVSVPPLILESVGFHAKTLVLLTGAKESVVDTAHMRNRLKQSLMKYTETIGVLERMLEGQYSSDLAQARQRASELLGKLEQ